MHEAEHILQLPQHSEKERDYNAKMTEHFAWYMVGRRGKHKESVAQKKRGMPAAVTQSSLAALPSDILAFVFRHLYKSPEAAISLAQTCQTLASEFLAHRSEIIGHRATSTGIFPVYDIPDLQRYRLPGCHADIDIWWSRDSAMRQIYALPEQSGAIEKMWDAAFSQVREHLHLKGHRSELLSELWPMWYVLQEQELNETRHASITCRIQLQSSTQLYVPAEWLQEHILKSAASALMKRLRERDCCISIRVKVYRVFRKNLYFLLSQNFCCSDKPDAESDLAETDTESIDSYVSWDDRFTPEAERLPCSQQLLVITGRWYRGESGQKGEVCGDQVIDNPQLDKDFCEWQSWDKDVWMYEPFSCEMTSEPRWYYT